MIFGQQFIQAGQTHLNLVAVRHAQTRLPLSMADRFALILWQWKQCLRHGPPFTAESGPYCTLLPLHLRGLFHSL